MPRERFPRVKTGCLTCRLRRKKCDEGRPRCQNCMNLNKMCYGPGYEVPTPLRQIAHAAQHQESQETAPQASGLRALLPKEQSPPGLTLSEEELSQIKAHMQHEEIKLARDSMLSEGPYDPRNQFLALDRERCTRILLDINSDVQSGLFATHSALSILFGCYESSSEHSTGHRGYIGSDTRIETPFHCVYGYNVSIASNVRIAAGCRIIDSARVIVQDDVCIDYGVSLICTSRPIALYQRRCGQELSASITIERGVWIGTGCIVMPGCRIGRAAIIDPGTLVTKNVPARHRAGGNPMKLSRDKLVEPETMDGLLETVASLKSD